MSHSVQAAPPRPAPSDASNRVTLGLSNRLLARRASAIATGFAAGKETVEVISAFGKAFIESRSVAVVACALAKVENRPAREVLRQIAGGGPADVSPGLWRQLLSTIEGKLPPCGPD